MAEIELSPEQYNTFGDWARNSGKEIIIATEHRVGEPLSYVYIYDINGEIVVATEGYKRFSCVISDRYLEQFNQAKEDNFVIDRQQGAETP